MLVSDILNSCAHDQVAEAAIASIGGPFAEAVKTRAVATGQSVGEFAAGHVRRFSSDASERDWRDLVAVMRGEDLALLSGFQVVLLRMMKSAMEQSDADSTAALSLSRRRESDLELAR